MRNIDRIHDLEAENRSLKSRLDAALTSESKFSVDAHRWHDIADREHQSVVEARKARDKAVDAAMQMEQAASSLLAEAAVLCGEEVGDSHVLRIPRPDVSMLLETWEVHTAPDADEYVITAKPRKESKDAAAHDGTGVPAADGTGAADTPEVSEHKD